jgi:hypothetical protein
MPGNQLQRKGGAAADSLTHLSGLNTAGSSQLWRVLCSAYSMGQTMTPGGSL